MKYLMAVIWCGMLAGCSEAARFSSHHELIAQMRESSALEIIALHPGAAGTDQASAPRFSGHPIAGSSTVTDIEEIDRIVEGLSLSLDREEPAAGASAPHRECTPRHAIRSADLDLLLCFDCGLLRVGRRRGDGRWQALSEFPIDDDGAEIIEAVWSEYGLTPAAE